MNYLVGLEMFKESLNLTGTLVIFSISYFSVRHSQGVSPWIIQKAIIPIDQISFLIEQTFLFRASGDIYRGLPTLYFSFYEPKLWLELKVHMFFGESKISDDCLSIVHKNIGQFEISVQELAVSHLHKPFDDVLEYPESLVFRDSSLFFDKVTQVTLVAELSYDITVRSFSDDIEALKDI